MSVGMTVETEELKVQLEAFRGPQGPAGPKGEGLDEPALFDALNRWGLIQSLQDGDGAYLTDADGAVLTW